MPVTMPHHSPYMHLHLPPTCHAATCLGSWHARTHLCPYTAYFMLTVFFFAPAAAATAYFMLTVFSPCLLLLLLLPTSC